MKIYLRDTNPEVVDAWHHSFNGIENVEPSCGDIFDIPAEAIVSPTNSFGDMTGGIDLAYRNRFGIETEQLLKKMIKEESHGELIVGNALLVPLWRQRYGWLLSAPTMRIPADVSNTFNAYLAFRAVLITAIQYQLNSIICPGLCTLTGRMKPSNSAIQMRHAYDQVMDYFKC